MARIEGPVGFGTLEWETEEINTTSISPRPDPNWRHTDSHGHEHQMIDGEYPTLESVPDEEPYWCEDCSEEHQDYKLVCVQCGETIEPGMTGPDLFQTFAPGRTTYKYNGEVISQERYEQLAAKYRRLREAQQRP